MRFGWAQLVLSVFLLLTSGASQARAPDLQGRVVAIADGDTLTVLTAQRTQVIVRLVEIDAPERGQPWGNRSKQTLSNLVFGRDVRVKPTGEDRYGRTLGRVYAGALDVNAELVRQGAAWAYRKYLTDPSLVRLEREAQNARRGLWSLPANQTVAPWTWRSGARSPEASAPAAAGVLGFSGAAVGPFRCGSKRYCSEMASCAEARFYLKQCGLSTIDGNADGKPCEKLCEPKPNF